MSSQEGSDARFPAAELVGGLAVLGAIGAAVMALAHLGIDIPVIADLGPGRLLLPVAIGFVIGAIAYGVVAAAAFGRRPWAWWAALWVNAVAFLSAAFPYRGPVSAVAMAVSLAAVAILVSVPGKRDLRG